MCPVKFNIHDVKHILSHYINKHRKLHKTLKCPHSFYKMNIIKYEHALTTTSYSISVTQGRQNPVIMFHAAHNLPEVNNRFMLYFDISHYTFLNPGLTFLTAYLWCYCHCLDKSSTQPFYIKTLALQIPLLQHVTNCYKVVSWMDFHIKVRHKNEILLSDFLLFSYSSLQSRFDTIYIV